jgi:hypothetical protein
MKNLRNLSCAAWLICCVAAPAAAQAPAMDVKTGLWEVSSTRSSAGMPRMPAMPQIPPEVLAQMPPAQRARIESAMRAAQGQSGGTHTSQVCVTQESLKRGLAFGAEDRPSCQQTVSKGSRTARELQMTCTERGGRQTIHVRYEAPTPDTMSGTVDIVMSDGGRQMSMKQVMRGRWIGPDCGDVKPK